MGLLDMLFTDQDQTQKQPAIDPNAINPIWGVPEALIQEMKKEQQKADLANAWSNLFGGAANIARGAQGGAPIYEQATQDPNAAMDGLAKRVMMFSQLRQNYEQQAQKSALNKMLPELSKKLGIDPSVLNALPDATKQELALKAIQGNPAEQVNLKLPEGEISALKQRDPSSPTGYRYTNIDGQPLNMPQLSQQIGQASADKKAREAEGTARGEKRAGLDTALNSLDGLNNLVQEVLDAPKLSGAVGNVLDRGKSFIPGTDEYGVGSRIEQLKNSAFLAAIPAMRGLGQLSNMEGAKVSEAFARLDRAQSEKDFRQALGDAQKSIGRLRDVAQREAGVAPSGSSSGGGEWTDLGNGLKIRKVQ